MCSGVNDNYDGVGREWLIQSGLIAASGQGSDRSGQDSLSPSLEMPGSEGEGKAAAVPSAARSCSGQCEACRGSGATGEGE